MARLWNLYAKASLTGAILWALTLLWTGQATAQDEVNPTNDSLTDQVGAVQYEGNEAEPPVYQEDESATDSAVLGDTSVKQVMDEVRRAYLMQQYDTVLDLCQEIRRDYPEAANRVDFYEKVSKMRMETLAKRNDKENPYPRISELMPELPSEGPLSASASNPQAGDPANAATAPTSPAAMSSQPMPLPPSMAPAPPRPKAKASLMDTLTGLPIWMLAVAGAVVLVLILLVLKLVMGGKGKKAETEPETAAESADENQEEMANTDAASEADMFDPLGGLDTSNADDPFATTSSSGDDPFGSMFDEVTPPTDDEPTVQAESQQQVQEEAPEKDLSAYENLLDSQSEKQEPVAFNQDEGPINFSFGDEDDVPETIESSADTSMSGVDSIMDLFGSDDSQDNTADTPAQAETMAQNEDLPAQDQETKAEDDDADSILTFDGIEDSEPTPEQAAETKIEDSVSDVFDEDFSISLDQSMADNTAMAQTQEAKISSEDSESAEDAGGEDLLLFDGGDDNTNVSDLRIDETIDLGSGNIPPAGDNDITVAGQTQVSPPLPGDEEPPADSGNDNEAADLFEREIQAGKDAFNSNNWKSAVHHLTIAAALQPESTEVKALLREASRQNKTEAEVGEQR